MKLGHHRRGLGDPGANLWFEREIGADGGPQVLESFDCVEHLTPDADVWWGGGSLPQHLGLLYADCEAKISHARAKRSISLWSASSVCVAMAASSAKRTSLMVTCLTLVLALSRARL